MTEKEINEKIEFKSNLINKLDKDIQKGKTKSIIIHVILFPVIVFGFKTLTSLISSESFFDFLRLNSVNNGFIILTLAIIVYSAMNYSAKNKEYKKKLENEIKFLRKKL